MADPIGSDGLLCLMSWLSPAFPVGSFSYSHGLEQAVEAGLLRGREDVAGWIATILGRGSGWIEAGLFLEAHRAVAAGDGARLAAVAELAESWRGTAETALESRAQGAAFLQAVGAAWPAVPLAPWLAALAAPSYGIAVAAAASAAGIAEEPALVAFLHALAANLVSAAVRLVPLGQSDGQRALAALAGDIPGVVQRARTTPLDELGSAAPMVDWTSMRHEIQYTRLFRS